MKEHNIDKYPNQEPQSDVAPAQVAQQMKVQESFWKISRRCNANEWFIGAFGRPIGTFIGFQSEPENNKTIVMIEALPELVETLTALVECPDYRNISTHEMEAAKNILARLQGGAQ